MRQEVTVGPDIIDYLHENDYDLTDPDNFGDFFGQLRQDIVMWNEQLNNMILEKIESYSNRSNSYEILSEFYLRELSKINQKEVKDIDELKNLKKLTNEDKVEYPLVMASKEKLWLKSEENTERLKIRGREKSNGTLKLPISFDDYKNAIINYGYEILKSRYTYHKFKGDFFPFDNFMKILLSDAKNIHIRDPYIYTHKNKFAINRINFIIGLVSENTPINIITLPYDSNQYVKNLVKCSACDKIMTIIEFEKFHLNKLQCPNSKKPTQKETGDLLLELKSDLESKYENVKLKFSRSFNLSERSIKTDKVLINLGHGLQAYDDSNKVTRETLFNFQRIGK